MFCENCGAQLKDGAKFCKQCGASLVEDNTNDRTHHVSVKVKKEPDEGSRFVEQRPKRKSHWFAWFLFLLLLTVVLLAFALLYNSPYTRDLYYYSGFDYSSNISLPADMEEQMISLNSDSYKGCYVLKMDGNYYLFDPSTGDFQTAKDIEAEAKKESDEILVSQFSVRFVTQGDSICMKSTLGLFDDMLTIVFSNYFHKATLNERIDFALYMYEFLTQA